MEGRGNEQGEEGSEEGKERMEKEKVNWTFVLLPIYTFSPAQIFLVFCTKK